MYSKHTNTRQDARHRGHTVAFHRIVVDLEQREYLNILARVDKSLNKVCFIHTGAVVGCSYSPS